MKVTKFCSLFPMNYIIRVASEPCGKTKDGISEQVRVDTTVSSN
ncbi:hypothetical protein U0070_023337 [Myodes glareolus]|uniref:Uncharacterized protein n=1 Tax=Myodes glareolus TaxID=447135 RepID=A0AAW0I1Z7_MYOGA